jgi:hypothetical protein
MARGEKLLLLVRKMICKLQILCICLRYVLLYWINFNIKWSCRLYLNHKIKRAAAKHTPTTSYHSFNKSTKPTIIITKKGPLDKNEINYDDAERLYSSWLWRGWVQYSYFTPHPPPSQTSGAERTVFTTHTRLVGDPVEYKHSVLWPHRACNSHSRSLSSGLGWGFIPIFIRLLIAIPGVVALL